MALSKEEIRQHNLAALWARSYGRNDTEIRKLMGISQPANKNRQKKQARKRFFAAFPNCFYCRTLLTKKNRSMDHYVPRSRKGTGSVDNLVTCCKVCNHRKDNQMPEEFLQEAV